VLDTLYITKSQVRQDMLRLYFSNASRKYYLRELERLLGHSAGNIRREFLRLQKDRLFNAERTGNLVFYSLNQAHPLFAELKSIVSKTIGVEGSIKAVLSSLENIFAAFIFGSFASKSEKETSDIDVMIIGRPDVSRLNERIRELERKLRREINISIYARSEYQAKKKSKSGFMLEVVNNPKIMLIGNEKDL